MGSLRSSPRGVFQVDHTLWYVTELETTGRTWNGVQNPPQGQF